jgi:hypothetical protein
MEVKPEIFISWSGTVSKQIAEALRDWLPLVIDTAGYWVSSRNISAGRRWSIELAGKLEHSIFGIVILTSGNLDSNWIMFEAGALSKNLHDGSVVPYMFGVGAGDLQGPLAQFQALPSNREGSLRLVKAIASALPIEITQEVLETRFEAFWPKLEQQLPVIPSQNVAANKDEDAKSSPEILRLERRLDEQNEMVRELLSGLTSMQVKSSNSTAVSSFTGLEKLVGAWKFSPSKSRGYGRIIDGDLHVAYCYGGDYKVTGVYYDWQRVGDYWVNKFRWLNGEFQGFGLFKELSADVIEGAWWFDSELTSVELGNLPQEYEDGNDGEYSRWERLRDIPEPVWAKTYFESL